MRPSTTACALRGRTSACSPRTYRIVGVIGDAVLNTNTVNFVINASLSTPQGSVSVSGVSDPSNIQNYSQLSFSGQTGEITKSLVYNATTYYVPQSATVGNKLCNGSLTFHANEGDFTGTFSFDITTQSYQYEKEIQLL